MLIAGFSTLPVVGVGASEGIAVVSRAV